jgi:hypothetical protein
MRLQPLKRTFPPTTQLGYYLVTEAGKKAADEVNFHNKGPVRQPVQTFTENGPFDRNTCLLKELFEGN